MIAEGPARWVIDSTRSTLKIRANSTLHAVTSTGHGLSGTVVGDLDTLAETAQGTVSVALKAQSFGDRLKDLAMHRQIDVKRWPEATYEVGGAEVLDQSPLRVRILGTLRYRGIERPLDVVAEGTWGDARIEATARFSLDLPSVGVKPPKMLFLKVADSVDVEVRVVAQHEA